MRAALEARLQGIDMHLEDSVSGPTDASHGGLCATDACVCEGEYLSVHEHSTAAGCVTGLLLQGPCS